MLAVIPFQQPVFLLILEVSGQHLTTDLCVLRWSCWKPGFPLGPVLYSADICQTQSYLRSSRTGLAFGLASMLPGVFSALIRVQC